MSTALILIRVIKLFHLILGLTGNIHAQLFKGLTVGLSKDDRRMSLTTTELAYLLKCDRGRLRRYSADGERNKHLVNMKSRIVVAQMIDLKILNRLDN